MLIFINARIVTCLTVEFQVCLLAFRNKCYDYIVD